MLSTISHLLALHFANELLAARQFLGPAPTAALPGAELQAGGTGALVAPLGAGVDAALQRLPARVAARGHALRARQKVLRLAARAPPRPGQGARPALGAMADTLAVMRVAIELLIAHLVALPVGLGTVA